MKKVAVIGCTGSIGTQTLDILERNRNEFTVTGLSCGSNIAALSQAAKRFGCNSIGVYDRSRYAELKSAAGDCAVFCGDDALTAVADDADIVVIAVVGMIGLKAVLYALGRNKTIALANKESLVAGGELVKAALARGGKLLPVDSEHSAVWQCLGGEKRFKRIILTASGGPFLNTPRDELKLVTPERAVVHPNWKMGKKISVDSATMMNKGLEIIEARWLFDTLDIDYVIHPESIVHSMVEFCDGSIIVQACKPDMRLPIQYALTYPQRIFRTFEPVGLPCMLSFLAPDENKFPAPRLAKQAAERGGNAAVVLNAANEAAVRLFLERKIAFTDIVDIVSRTLDAEKFESVLTLDGVFETHNRVYDKIYFEYGVK